MTKKEAKKIATEIRLELQLAPYNDPTSDVGYDFFEFSINDTKLNVFAYIGKMKDETSKIYSVYAGVEYLNSDNIYADYDHSTTHLRTSELADAIYELANMYIRPGQALEDLKKIMN